jgi:hypothetical protein
MMGVTSDMSFQQSAAGTSVAYGSHAEKMDPQALGAILGAALKAAGMP